MMTPENKTTATIAAADVAAVKKPARKKPAAKKPAAKPTPKPKPTPRTFTSVDLATEHKMNPKTLRARIRRNIDKWAPLFIDGEKHVFPDNATTRKAVLALLNA